MEKPRIWKPSFGLAAMWFGPAGVALSWITGSEGVPVTIWWIVLAIASCGIAASLAGLGQIYNLLFLILFCVGLLTMDYWLWMIFPIH